MPTTAGDKIDEKWEVPISLNQYKEQLGIPQNQALTTVQSTNLYKLRYPSKYTNRKENLRVKYMLDRYGNEDRMDAKISKLMKIRESIANHREIKSQT